MSGDGQVVAGLYWRPGASGGSAHAMAWTAAAGIQDLGSSGQSSRINGASTDGGVLVGWDEHPQFGNRRAAVWAGGVRTVLDDSDWPSEALAVNAAGTIAVGYSGNPQDFQTYATRWAWNGQSWVATQLGVIRKGRATGYAFASSVSADGSLIVGGYRPDVQSPTSKGFLWTEATGFVDAKEYFTAQGVKLNPIAPIIGLGRGQRRWRHGGRGHAAACGTLRHPHAAAAPAALNPNALSTETTLSPELAGVASALREGLAPLVHDLAGAPARPVRLQQGIGLDKTLASRLVQAVRAPGDAEFLHALPSPAGLRIVLQRAAGHADERLLAPLEAAVLRFEALLDGLPGGRQALHARIGDASRTLRDRREQEARQASFKAVSFLFGHFCETVTTALFMRPAAEPGWVDAIEVHRRIGLQRISASAQMPLLSVQAGLVPADAATMLPLGAAEPSERPADYLYGAGAEAVLPLLQLQRDGRARVFVLGGGDVALPPRITTAWAVRRAQRLAPEAAHLLLRNYMLHTPCRTVVRDLFLAPGLWPDAWPQPGFFIPGPSGTPPVDVPPGEPHVRRLDLAVRVEQLPAGRDGFLLEDAADHADTLEAVLARAGAAGTAWRGWRCRIAYPVPLVEMQLALRFAGRA